MSYDTFTDKAPENQTGITTSLIQVIQHNPRHPLTARSNYPAQYPQFVTPTNDQMSSILIEDEGHPLTDVETDENNRLFLHHKPANGSTISVSDGVINSALTDYENGIIYFSTVPTGSVIVQYQADPDKYYGEYLQAIQDVIHSIVWLLGAGQTLNEGLKNAEIFVNSLPAGLQARMPNAIRINGLSSDLQIRSSTDPSAPGGTRHTIALGNGEDTVVVDAHHFLARRSIDGSPMNMRFGDETGDFASFGGSVDVTGSLTVGVRGASKNPLISPSAVAAFQQTGTPYTANTLIAAFHGDVVIHGDLFVLGQTTVLNVTRNIQVNVYEEDLEVGNNLFVRGKVRFGVSTAQTAQFSGKVEITGGLDVYGAGAEPIRFDVPVIFTNGGLKGPFQQGTIDGLDPSYIECIRKYVRSSFKHEWPIEGMRTPLFEGTASYVTGLDLIADTGAPSSLADAFPTGTYWSGKFSDGDFLMIIKSGAQAGARIPVKGYNTSLKQWSLARELSGAYAVGDQFAIFHPANSLPSFVQAGVGLSVTIQASSVWPLLGWQAGVIKKRTSTYEVAGLPANSTLYIFMSAATGVNGMDEDEPTFFYSTSNVESDRSILLAEVATDASSVTSVTCYAINGMYDTLWVKFDSVASGNTMAVGADWTIDVRLGNTKRKIRHQDKIEIFVAPDSSGPDLANMKKVSPASGGFYVKSLTGTQMVLATPSGSFLGVSAPYWLRVVLT